jgi:hypothetical protein
LSSAPPHGRYQPAYDIGHDVPGITNAVPHDVRTDPLEEDGPNAQMKNDFGRGRRRILLPQSQPPLRQKQRRQSARNQKHIIEIGMKEYAVNVRFQQPAIESIGATAGQEQGIGQITKAAHFKAAPE